MAMAANIQVPFALRFDPDDHEVIQHFLDPFIQNKELPLDSLVRTNEDMIAIISGTAPQWDKSDYPYFRTGHYWFVFERQQKKKRVDRDLGVLGIWKPLTRAKNIMVDKTLIGFKQSFHLVKEKLETGWFCVEYVRYATSEQFESCSICHLFFDASQKVNPGFQSGIAQYAAPQPPLLNDDVQPGENIPPLLNDGDDEEHVEHTPPPPPVQVQSFLNDEILPRDDDEPVDDTLPPVEVHSEKNDEVLPREDTALLNDDEEHVEDTLPPPPPVQLNTNLQEFESTFGGVGNLNVGLPGQELHDDTSLSLPYSPFIAGMLSVTDELIDDGTFIWDANTGAYNLNVGLYPLPLVHRQELHDDTVNGNDPDA